MMEGAGEICIDKICRSCLGEKTELRSLFTVYEGSSDVSSAQYSRMLMESAKVSVHEGDGLPGNICDQCSMMLVQANVFKAMCERADAKLRAYVGEADHWKEMCTQTEEIACLQMYNCGQCQKKFKGMAALQRHCRRHLRENSVACSVCSNLYSDMDALRRHVSKVHVGVVVEATKVEMWENMKQEPGPGLVERVRVKEEPMDVYHDEDDTHSDYFPIKEEFHSDQSDFLHTSGMVSKEKNKTFKKKIKKQIADSGDLPENHPCTVCPRVFASKTHLDAHLAKHAARAQRYACPSCDKCFGRSSHLKRHQLIHASLGDNSMCPHCPKSFPKPEDLDRHIQIKHSGDGAKNPKVAFCTLCDRGFTTQRYLEIHMRSHSAEGGEGVVQGFPCKACPHISETKEEARAHTQWHRRAERPFLCSECGQGFTRDAYLTVHMRRHRGEKPFSCGYCGKGFPRRSDLDIHERYHTEDKRHTCTICGKAFHRQYNLKVHLRVHTGERPYVCPYCPKAFTQPNDLKAHVRRHTGERFTCELCSAQFLHGYHLTQHKRAVHAVDKPSHIRRLSKFPSAVPPHPPSEPPPLPPRGRARQAHIQLAAHMASILAQTQQQQQSPPVQTAPLPLSLPPPAS